MVNKTLLTGSIYRIFSPVTTVVYSYLLYSVRCLSGVFVLFMNCIIEDIFRISKFQD